MNELENIKKQILDLVEQYAKEDLKEKPFIGGITHIPVTGKVIDEVDIKTLENQKHLFDAPEVEEAPVYPSVTPQPQQQVSAQQNASQPDPRALQWAQSNSWFGQDAPKTGAAYAIDAQLKMEGYNPSSEEYYSELDMRLEDAFPTMKRETKQPKQVVASVSRVSSAPSKKVSLTPSQLAMAKKLGVPPNEYAKFVRNTNDQ